MKNVVITGTSRGIGFELVKLFAEEDFNVLALSRNKEPVAKLKLDNVNSFSFDLGNESDLKNASDFVQKEWSGKVDILIHNAGAFLNKPFQKTTLEEFRAIYEINVFGLIGLTQQLLPFMTAKSHILSISSMDNL